MNAIYYYIYLTYTKLIPDDEPFATTVFVLSFVESTIIYSLLSIFVSFNYCILINKWIGIGLMVFFLVVNYLMYNKSGLSKKIIDQKPKILKSHILSISIVVFVFLVAIFSLFFGPIYVKRILEQCH